MRWLLSTGSRFAALRAARLCAGGADPLKKSPNMPQEWSRWQENYSRLSRRVDEAEAFLSSGGMEGDVQTTEHRLEACQVLLLLV